jgi:WD40 repeat protein
VALPVTAPARGRGPKPPADTARRKPEAPAGAIIDLNRVTFLDAGVHPDRGSAARPFWRRGPVRALLLGILAAGLVLAAGVVVRIQTDKGDVIIQTDDPNVEVEVVQGGKLVTVLDVKSGQKFLLDTGEYTLRLAGTPEGLQIETPAHFTLKRGDKRVVTITRVPKGEVVIRTDDPDVRVEVLKGGRVVKPLGSRSGRKFHLDPGEYTLRLAGNPDGLALDVPTPFTLRRGETKVVTVRRVPKEEKVGEVRRFIGYEPNSWVTRAEFTPDGRRVVAAQGPVRVWDAATGKPLMVLGTRAFGWGLALAPDGKTAYQSTDDGVVHIFDLEKAKEVGRLHAPGRGPSEVELSADGKRLLINVLHVWKSRLCEVPGGKELARLEDGVRATLSPDGTRVALYRDKRVVLRDIASGKEVSGFDIDVEGEVTALGGFRFTPDGRFLVAHLPRNVVRLWDVATGKERSSFNVPGEKFLRLAVSPDSRRILCCSDPSSPATNPPIILWDVETAKEVCRLSGPENGVFSLAFSPDGRSAVVTGADGTVRLLRLPDPPRPKTVGEVRRFEGHEGTPRALAYSPDGRYILSGTGWPSIDGTIRLWDSATGKEVRRFEGRTSDVDCIAFSRDGRHALSASIEGVRLWDVASGKQLGAFKGHFNRWRDAFSVVFSPDGRHALSGHKDNTVRLWDLNTGKEVRKYEGHGGWVLSVAFSPDGRHAASGSLQDQTIRVWEVETGKEVKRLEGTLVAFSPNGRFLLSAGQIQGPFHLHLWDSETGKEIRPFIGHTHAICSVAFSPDGHRVLSGGADGTIRLWEVATGKELHRFEKFQVWLPVEGRNISFVYAVFAPDGHYAVSGGIDGIVRLWRLPDPSPAKENP